MMTIEQTPLIPISEFTASKQAGLFEILKQPRFSGQLVLSSPKQQQWIFHLYMGRLMYATGGDHPVRRWRRNLILHCPQMTSQVSEGLQQIDTSNSICWEYELLCLWVEQKKITREQAAAVIQSVISEVLFDVTQAMKITYEIKRDNSLSKQLVLIDADQAITEAENLWQAWQAAKVADRSPNKAPVIRQQEALQARSSVQAYQAMVKLLDGQHTLRDLAVRMKRDVIAVTRSLLPHIQLGFVELVDIPDLPSPVAPPTKPYPSVNDNAPKPLIACVDDSPLICQTMEKILTSQGYQYLALNDALRAIATLLARKPDLIFLDLIMPNANGYEICSQLRKLSFFRNTPIVILTGNDGIIDRVRAKMVGSTDFISKPVDADTVLEVIQKHLHSKT